MKDYYYILGIKSDASLEDVKKAYRKLSLKFHPDKNEGDEFFRERFLEIQEAYDTLIDENKRKNYDAKKGSSAQTSSSNYSNFSPFIEYFKANKNTFEYEEEITFSWKTINSDKVILKPFGQVTPIGQKSYKIKDFKNASLTFELVAENTSIQHQVKSSISLMNNTYKDLFQYFKSEIQKENVKKEEENSRKQNDRDKEWNKSSYYESFIIKLFIFLVIIIVIIIIASIFSHFLL
jgi:curved DNA-binding protein CbpA